jgi:hypothetical protein
MENLKQMFKQLSVSWILAIVILNFTIGASLFGMNGYYISVYWNVPSGIYFITTIIFNTLKYKK